MSPSRETRNILDAFVRDILEWRSGRPPHNTELPRNTKPPATTNLSYVTTPGNTTTESQLPVYPTTLPSGLPTTPTSSTVPSAAPVGSTSTPVTSPTTSPSEENSSRPLESNSHPISVTTLGLNTVAPPGTNNSSSAQPLSSIEQLPKTVKANQTQTHTNDRQHATTPSPAPVSYATSSDSAPLSSPTAALAVARTSHNTTGAIVGGVIGGLALLLAAFCALILLRRRLRARRTAPSAEFMDIARGATPALARATPGSGDRLLLPLARQGSLEDDDPPPPFTPGSYGADPVYEKVQAAAAMREHYQRRDSYVAAHADGGGGGAGEGESEGEGEGGELGGEDDKGGGFAWAI